MSKFSKFSTFYRFLTSSLAAAALLGMSGCSAPLGSVHKPLQNTPLKAPLVVISGWVDDHSLDSPDSITDDMRLSARQALGKADLTAVLQAGVRAALEKQGITPTFITAPTPYNARFDMSPPPQLNQVASGSALVVGLRPEMVCVASALERIKGTKEIALLYPCNLVAIEVSVVHHSADGTVDPPLVWRETFTRATTGGSRCRSVEACTRDGMDALLNTLRNKKMM